MKATEGQQIAADLVKKKKKNQPNKTKHIFFSLKLHLESSVILREELSFRNEETSLPKEGKADNELRLGMIKRLPLKQIKLCNATFP